MHRFPVKSAFFREHNPELYAETVEIDGEKILHLKIWSPVYKVLLTQWKSFEFPLETQTNNHLYLAEEHVHYVFQYLDEFIKNGFVLSGNILIPTEYQSQNIKDIFNNRINIFNSSSAIPKIWFGYDCNKKFLYTENNETKTFIPPFEKKEILIQDQLHLDKTRAENLLKFLKKIWNN